MEASSWLRVRRHSRPGSSEAAVETGEKRRRAREANPAREECFVDATIFSFFLFVPSGWLLDLAGNCSFGRVGSSRGLLAPITRTGVSNGQ